MTPFPGPSFLEAMWKHIIHPLTEAKHMAEFMPLVNEASNSLDNGFCPSLDSLCNHISQQAERTIRGPGPKVPSLAYQPFIRLLLELQRRARDLGDRADYASYQTNMILVVEWALQAAKASEPSFLIPSDVVMDDVLLDESQTTTAKVELISTSQQASASPNATKVSQGTRRAFGNQPEYLRRRRRTRRTLSSDTVPKPTVQCPLCYQHFEGNDRKSNLKKHIDSVHSNKQFDCCWEHCTKHYNRCDNLAKHVREDHIPFLSYNVCLWRGCGQSFQTEVELKTHVKKHTSKPKANSW